MKTLTKIILVLFFLFSVFCPLFFVAEAAIPHLINYQGRLTDSSGTPLNGSYSLTFRIYDAEAAGNLLWEEAHSGVLIQKGIFSILLGSVTSLNLAFDKPYWLEIKVGSEVMSPRQQITSAGYAIRAENTDSLPRGVIAMWSGSITDIPSGWALCNGENGTPDLRDKFIVGAGNNYVVRTTGGEATHTLTVNEIPSHRHYMPGRSNAMGGGGSVILEGPNNYSTWQTTETGGGQAHENRPPYYALAYIMKL